MNFLKRNYSITTNHQLSSKQTEIKLLITNKEETIKNKEEKFLSKSQNKFFEPDPKKFFNSLDVEKIEVETPLP